MFFSPLKFSLTQWVFYFLRVPPAPFGDPLCYIGPQTLIPSVIFWISFFSFDTPQRYTGLSHRPPGISFVDLHLLKFAMVACSAEPDWPDTKWLGGGEETWSKLSMLSLSLVCEKSYCLYTLPHILFFCQVRCFYHHSCVLSPCFFSRYHAPL